MEREAPAKPRELLVTIQGMRWKALFLILCLLHATSAMKGPRLVSGETGGAVTIQCRYAPLSANKHQRKYWCRLGSPLWICHTIVSTNHYTHHDYQGRVDLTDFPQRAFFLVRLSQLSLKDAGYYRCGIGNRNDMLYFSMNLTVSSDPFNTIHTAFPALDELITASSVVASPVANTWTSGITQILEGQESEWDTVAPATGTSKTTRSTEREQTPAAARTTSQEAGREEGFITVIVPTPESTASKFRSMSNTTEDIWIWGTESSVTNRSSTREDGKKKTTTETHSPQEETEKVKIAPNTVKATETIKPPVLVSEHMFWETIPERIVVSKQRAPDSIEKSSPTSSTWTTNTIHVEVAPIEGRANGSRKNNAEESDSLVTSSQPLAAGSMKTPGKESSMKSAFPEEKGNSWILTPVSTLVALVLLVSLILLQRRFWRKRTALKTERTPRVTLIQMTHFLEANLLPD